MWKPVGAGEMAYVTAVKIVCLTCAWSDDIDALVAVETVLSLREDA